MEELVTGCFAASDYLYLLEQFRRRGYEFGCFESIDPAAKIALLRHDVDVSLSCAATLAKIEARVGVRATYFVSLRSLSYNPFSRSGMDAARAISDYGHELGLHFDPTHYEQPPRSDLSDAVRRECDILEWAAKRAVVAVSFHRPTADLLGAPGFSIGRPHTYEPAYFRNIGYCSDSQGSWRFGHPLDHEAVRAGRALQLLTHPVWWVGESGQSVFERVEGVIEQDAARLRKTLAEEIQSYGAQLRRDERSENDRHPEA
jgi:hypothetical protein